MDRQEWASVDSGQVGWAVHGKSRQQSTVSWQEPCALVLLEEDVVAGSALALSSLSSSTGLFIDVWPVAEHHTVWEAATVRSTGVGQCMSLREALDGGTCAGW